MKKILKYLIAIIIICIVLFAVMYFVKYSNYKKITNIVENAKQQVLDINNVKISGESFFNGENNTGVINNIVIKDNVQCDTNDRKRSEENGIEYRIINFEKNVSYSVFPNDKIINIENVENEEYYTATLIESVVIPQFQFSGNTKLKLEEDENNCYKITVYDKNDEIYERSYWISKENGLLNKDEQKYRDENDVENDIINNYYYEIGTVTDEDVKSINLEDYIDYKVMDLR